MRVNYSPFASTKGQHRDLNLSLQVEIPMRQPLGALLASQTVGVLSR